MAARALTAYLRRPQVPARAALQGAIKELKLPLSLDDGYAPFATAGYLPCTLDGEDAGFDLRFKAVAAADLASTPGVQSGLGERHVAMSFKWGGDPREAAAARIVCAALAGSFGAIVQQGDEDVLLSPEALVEKAKAALE
jgi:hypothetical protein